MNRANEMRFAVENTLGKLAKWLRILGFDTFYKPDLSAEKLMDIETGRILLTRTTRIRGWNTSRKLIFITSDNPFEQVREVIGTLGITQKDARPFSRCVRC
ncbi:MAG: Mut7-C RNAse domain-containing protein, partial [Desulfobacteraceae bacterium]|nr:Mut7-C RNAse domain-containing protein [Desulfobacteraceae bacterium]